MTAAQEPFSRDVAALVARWRQGLPGRAAMEAMAPERRDYLPLEAARARGCREAAALVLVYPRGGRACIALTLRRSDLADHGGQVSLPGGRCDLGEEAADCALREAWEELAVPPATVTLVGPLTPLYIAPSGHCVQPILATAAARPSFSIAEAEVAALIEAPVDCLTDPELRRCETWSLGGEDRQVPFFFLAGHKVWGATAMILNELGVLWNLRELADIAASDD